MPKQGAPEVRIGPVNLNGPGVVHRQGDDLVKIPEVITAEVLGLPWDVRFVLRLNSELNPEIAELTIQAREGGPPVGPDLVRGFRLGAAKDAAIQKAAVRFTDVGDDRWRLNPESVPDYRVSAATRPQRRRVTTEDLQRVVDAYRELKGERDFLLRIADKTGHGRATVHRYLRRAQAEGLLEEDEY